ncbi:hypothetical protein IWW50_000373 [Coemansia erecta]|nr:hypothetical protein IWW50_000373 [Coemansia erecta]
MADSSSTGVTPKKKRPASLMKFFGKKHTDTHDEPVHEQQSPQPEAPSAIPKRAPSDNALFTFKHGKLGLAEKKLGLERHPSVIAAVFGFHQLIAQLKLEPDGLPLARIPREHWPLIAMLVQERDVTIASLVRSVEQQLCPVLFGEESTCNSDILAVGTVEEAITQIAENANYGVCLADVQRRTADVDEVPHNLQIQRWEVRDTQLLPKDVQEIVCKRRLVREDARKECAQWFVALDDETHAQLLAGTLKKLKSKIAVPRQLDTPWDTGLLGEGSAKGPLATASPRKKQHVLRGQKSLQNFFATERHAPSTVPPPKDTRDYYTSTFLPFNLRNDTELYKHRTSPGFDTSRIDALVNISQSADANSTLPSARELLHEFAVASAPTTPGTSATPVVCDGVDLDEVELELMRLRRMPMKLLQFHGNRRPAYFGTCSKRVRGVGARRPLARDTSELDYDVDSDAEWEAEDEEGEELHSDDDDDDDDDDDENDEDFDEESGFVVGDGEVLSRQRSEDGSGSSDDDEEFNSEDEEMDEINPDEEVGAGEMDVDDVILIDDEAVKPAPRPKKPSTTEKHKHKHKQRVPQRRKVIPLTPVVVALTMENAEANSTDMDICSDSPDQPAADDAATKLQILARLTVAPVGADAVFPLHISVDSGDMWAKKGADGASSTADADNAEGTSARKGKVITDADLGALTSIVHGSSLGMMRLVEELKRVIPGATKAQIERLIHEHAKKEKRPPTTRSLWYVNADLVTKLKDMNLLDPAIANDTNSLGCVAKDPDIPALFEHAAKRQRTGGIECEGGVP